MKIENDELLEIENSNSDDYDASCSNYPETPDVYVQQHPTFDDQQLLEAEHTSSEIQEISDRPITAITMGVLIIVGGVILFTQGITTLTKFNEQFILATDLLAATFGCFFISSVFCISYDVHRNLPNELIKYSGVMLLLGSAIIIIGSILIPFASIYGIVLNIVGSSLLLVYFFIRNFSAIINAVLLLNKQMQDATNPGASRVVDKILIYRLHFDGLSSIVYLVAGILYLVASIAWVPLLESNSLHKESQQRIGVLNIVSGIMYIIGGTGQTAPILYSMFNKM
ncbi:6 TM domain-containing transmembrane protein [Acrasis kona]|uniref:6 TM domain-containing transmembrane protein n=1 Tax=Acrasis kona TaxID=1008807 RepID=A0AAW2Z833_9EUKA